MLSFQPYDPDNPKVGKYENFIAFLFRSEINTSFSDIK